MNGEDSSGTSPSERFPRRRPVSELIKQFEGSPKKRAQEERQIQGQFQNQEDIQYQEESQNQEHFIDYDNNDFDPNQGFSNQDEYHQSYRDEFEEPPTHAEAPPYPDRFGPEWTSEVKSRFPDLDFDDSQATKKWQEEPEFEEDRRHMARYLTGEYDSSFPSWLPDPNRAKKKNRYATAQHSQRNVYEISASDSDDYPEDDSDPQDKPVSGSSPKRATENQGAGKAADEKPFGPEGYLERKLEDSWIGTVRGKPLSQMEKARKKEAKERKKRQGRKTPESPYIKDAVEKAAVSFGLRIAIRFAWPYATTGY